MTISLEKGTEVLVPLKYLSLTVECEADQIGTIERYYKKNVYIVLKTSGQGCWMPRAEICPIHEKDIQHIQNQLKKQERIKTLQQRSIQKQKRKNKSFSAITTGSSLSSRQRVPNTVSWSASHPVQGGKFSSK